jgi:hypothetical protein
MKRNSRIVIEMQKVVHKEIKGRQMSVEVRDHSIKKQGNNIKNKQRREN